MYKQFKEWYFGRSPLTQAVLSFVFVFLATFFMLKAIGYFFGQTAMLVVSWIIIIVSLFLMAVISIVCDAEVRKSRQ